MDNDYLTSLLVKLLTNLLNNHCPWLYLTIEIPTDFIHFNPLTKLLEFGKILQAD